MSFGKIRSFALRNVKALVIVLLMLSVGGVVAAAAITLVGKQADGTIVVPTNQILHPAGTTVLLGQRPVDIALRSDGKQLAVMTTSLTFLLDPVTGKVLQSFDKAPRSMAGLAYSPDGSHLYYSKGEGHAIAVVSIDSTGTAKVEDSIDTGDNTWPSGLSISPDGKTLYVALFGTNSLGIIDLSAKPSIKSVPTGSSPFGAYVSPDGKRVYISNWGGALPKRGDAADPIFPVKVDPFTGATVQGSLSVYNVASAQMEADIVVGQHPTAITFDKGSTRLYVTNSNEDTVSVIDLTDAHKAAPELARIPVRPGNGLPFGSMPNGLALSPDGGTLYVANGGNNAIAVVRLDDSARPASSNPASVATQAPTQAATQNAAGNSMVVGFIPTEWFPVGVVVSADGKQLYVANNKGEGSLNVAAGFDAKSVFNLTGSVSLIGTPSTTQLADYTAQVDANSRYAASLASSLQKPRPNMAALPIPERVGEPSVFKHVIYIIKENRTYDQVFGDMGKGNSDPKLAQFPRKVSPNHHALADRFGLLDNYYACAVNSADGHQWTDEAIANVFAERVYGNYPNNSTFNTTAYGNDSLDLAPDSLWTNAVGHGVSLRNYGEGATDTLVVVNQKQTDGSYKAVDRINWNDIYKNWKNKGDQFTFDNTSLLPTLLKTEDRAYPGFNTLITDQVRADEWQREFAGYVKDNNLPQLEVLWLPTDHTSGVRTGVPTPNAQVADNDLALGRIMDTLSHSPYWKDTVVFVTEDDAQNGTDHVDGHRTVGLVMSAYNKNGQVNSTLYNQTSMVRTMEQILGVPPMNQFDLTATLMSDVFTTTPDLTPYTALTNEIPLDQLGGQPIAGSTTLADVVASDQMNFAFQDANNEDVLNQIIWRSTMPNQPYPTFNWQRSTVTDSEDAQASQAAVPANGSKSSGDTDAN